MAKKRNFLNLEVQRFLLKEREKNKSLRQISKTVYDEFQVIASKSVVHRICQKKESVLTVTKNLSKRSL